jgi:hypothetical protein
VSERPVVATLSESAPNETAVAGVQLCVSGRRLLKEGDAPGSAASITFTLPVRTERQG